MIEWVEPESIIITDDWGAYNGLEEHFIDVSESEAPCAVEMIGRVA